MSQSENPPKGRVIISLHRLYVEVEHEGSYPDQLTDLSNRAYEVFVQALTMAKTAGCDIRGYEFEYDEFEDDE